MALRLESGTEPRAEPKAEPPLFYARGMIPIFPFGSVSLLPFNTNLGLAQPNLTEASPNHHRKAAELGPNRKLPASDRLFFWTWSGPAPHRTDRQKTTRGGRLGLPDIRTDINHDGAYLNCQ